MKSDINRKEMNNYQKWCEQWREKFMKLDQEELKRRLPELKEENDNLVIHHFGRKFGIHKDDGNIMALEDEDIISCYEKLNIYTLFGYVSSEAHYKDDWVSFDKLKDMAPFSSAFKNGIIQPFSQIFNGHSKELEAAFKAMGGTKLSWSDIGYELKAFECIPIRFLFWEGDDEFPAQGNVLFDSSATDFIHGESLTTIMSVGMDKIVKKSGVCANRVAFTVC